MKQNLTLLGCQHNCEAYKRDCVRTPSPKQLAFGLACKRQVLPSEHASREGGHEVKPHKHLAKKVMCSTTCEGILDSIAGFKVWVLTKTV